MLTVLDLLTKTTGYFEKKHIESPRYNAEILLAFVMNCRRIDLYLMFDKPVADADIDRYRELIKKRGENHPLQYLIGSVEFYNVTLKVNQSALIPRPETELLVETVIESAKEKGNCRILDIGSGSGNIPVALGHNLKQAEIVSVDVSTEALNLCKENSASYNLEDRLTFACIDVFSESIFSLGKFDYIISNPPYVSKEEFGTLQPEIVRYEPRNAVTDEADGYRFYKRIAMIAPQLLVTGGMLLFELGITQYATVWEFLAANGFDTIQIHKDLQGIERVISGVLR